MHFRNWREIQFQKTEKKREKDTKNRNAGRTSPISISKNRGRKVVCKKKKKKRFFPFRGNASTALYSMKGVRAMEDFRGFGGSVDRLCSFDRDLCQRASRNGLRMIGGTAAREHTRRIKTAAVSTRDNAVAK